MLNSNFSGKLKGIQKMLAARKEQAIKKEGAVVYTGSWHDSIPRRLILNPDLSPVEKLTWQIIRTHISQPGEDGAWPSIGRIAKLANVSRPTIQNAIDVLEASRWIQVLRRVRDEHGNVIGNYYMLHDAPMSVAETMALSPGYISMLKRMSALNGPSKRRVKMFARKVLRDLNYNMDDVVQSEPKDIFTSIQENMNVNQQVNEEGSLLQSILSEVGHSESVVQSEPTDNLITDFNWSDKLSKTLQKRASTLMFGVPVNLRDTLLKNFNASLEKGSVKSPLRYLESLVERINQGTFVDVFENITENSYEKALSIKLSEAQKVIDEGGGVIVRGKEVDCIYGLNISFKEELSPNVYTVNAMVSKLLPDDIEILRKRGES